MPRIQQLKQRKDSSDSNSQKSDHQSDNQKNPNSNSFSIEQFHKLSLNLQSAYASVKQSEESTSILMTQQTTKVLIHLKQLYLQEQSTIVKGIKEMAEQSKLIIEDLNNIENEIDKYQNHIEEWIKKIQETAPFVEKIKNVESSFKKKATNFAKLKDFLNVERPKRR